MSTERKVGSVTYRDVDQGYFDQRGLKRHAGVWMLWALGVAAVISGDFSGWNFGLDVGGFGGLFIATIVITIMYIGLCYSISEMSPAMPHTGGAYSFARSSMGPWGGFITGVAENIEYVVTPVVVVYFASIYAQSVFNDLFGFELGLPWWWVIFYAIFVGLNIIGIEATMRFSVVIAVISLAVLAVFFVLAIPEFDAAKLTNIVAEEGGTSFLPFGIAGIFAALPFAIWFYLAIEELPLAAEESMDPKRDVPRGTMWGLWTLVITGMGVLFLNTGVGDGAEGIRTSGEPLLDGFRQVLGSDTSAAILGLFALTGLIASFHTIIYAYGRNIYSLSRAGYFPHWMSLTHGKRKTPYVALLLGAVVGLALAFLLDNQYSGTAGAALLSMAVFGAVISYFMQMLSFIRLRRTMPNIQRPYRSPVGIFGAAVAGLIALVSLVALFLNDAYRPGVYGVAIWFVLALLYFALSGRNKLVLSPEEEFAMTQGEHGHPEEEGYGTTSVADTKVTDAEVTDPSV
ncbi:MAG TPA: ethanolamine permease [Acidimicrobiia bacterium]|jgi:ethanolamine permease|nr:ethanolamine permease [Acidimicrobiia bacterium]